MFRFCQTVIDNAIDPTIEEYDKRIVTINNEHYVEIKVIDLGAAEGTWQQLFTNIMKASDGILMVYSVVNAPSLLFLDELIQLRDGIFGNNDSKRPIGAGSFSLLRCCWIGRCQPRA
jgi:hypothetical protein